MNSVDTPPIAADPDTFAEAIAVLQACHGPARRHVKLAESLAAAAQVVARQDDDETARHMVRQALAWIAAEVEVCARERAAADRDHYGRDVDVDAPRRTSRFVILPEDIDGYPVGRWA